MYVYCIHITDISSSEEGGVSFGTLMYPDLRDRAWQTKSAWEPGSQDKHFPGLMAVAKLKVHFFAAYSGL